MVTLHYFDAHTEPYYYAEHNYSYRFSKTLNRIGLLLMVNTVLNTALLNADTALALSLSISNSIGLLIDTLGALLSPPSVWAFIAEENFNLLNSLAASLRVGEPELKRTQNTHCTEDQEKPILDIAEGRRNEESDSEVELPTVSMLALGR
jgi:hypothetical protein